MRELIATGRIAALAALLAGAGLCHAAVAEDAKIEAFSVWQGRARPTRPASSRERWSVPSPAPCTS